jgi:hypothetical protein
MSKAQSIFRAKTPLIRSRKPWLLEEVTERENSSLSCANCLNLADAEPNLRKFIPLGREIKLSWDFLCEFSLLNSVLLDAEI